MKKSIVICFLAISLLASTANAFDLEVEAKKMADHYYGAVKKIIDNPLKVSETGVKLFNMFGTDRFGREMGNNFPVANDIASIFKLDKTRPVDITIKNYLWDLADLAEKRRLSNFSYVILQCNEVNGPSNDLKEEPQFMEVVVRKIFMTGQSTPVEVDETMSVQFIGKDVKIVAINNKYGSHETTGDLLMEALHLYRRWKYKEAFELFEKVMQKYPNHQEASYYLGTMLYKNQGCKKKYPTRYERDRKAVEYWKMSQLGRNAICYYSDGYDCD